MISPIVILDDSPTALAASGLLRRDPAIRACYQLDGATRGIQIVTSARALWAWLAEQPLQAVEVLLVDQHLPDALGSQLIGSLRNHRALSPQARILGWSSAEDAAPLMRRAGADGFVWKLADPAQLAATVGQLAGVEALHMR